MLSAASFLVQSLVKLRALCLKQSLSRMELSMKRRLKEILCSWSSCWESWHWSSCWEEGGSDYDVHIDEGGGPVPEAVTGDGLFQKKEVERGSCSWSSCWDYWDWSSSGEEGGCVMRMSTALSMSLSRIKGRDLQLKQLLDAVHHKTDAVNISTRRVRLWSPCWEGGSCPGHCISVWQILSQITKVWQPSWLDRYCLKSFLLLK